MNLIFQMMVKGCMYGDTKLKYGRLYKWRSIHTHIKAGELQKLNVDKLLGGSVCFSPDGSEICYTASIREKGYYRNHIQDSTLEIYDINTGELIQPLTDFDSTVMPLQWTAKGVLIRWQNKTNYLIGLLAEDGTVEILSEK